MTNLLPPAPIKSKTEPKSKLLKKFWKKISSHWALIYTALSYGGLLYFFQNNLGWLTGLSFLLLTMPAIAYLYLQKRDLKKIFFYASVREDSPLQFFRNRQLGIFLIASTLGAFLVLSLSVFLLTVSWVVLTIASLPLVLLPFLRKYYGDKLSPLFKTTSGVCLTNFFTTLTLGLLIMVLLMAGKWVELKFFIHDHHLATAGQMASYVNDKVNHSLIWFQHLGRTLHMMDLQVLRIHQYAEGWAAHFLLFYFLLPSTLAAFTMPIIFSGLYILFKGKHRQDDPEITNPVE